MSMPKVGMEYSDVARRCHRIAHSKTGDPTAKTRLINSLRNQCRLANGQEALHHLDKEINASPTFSCAGNKQVGCCMKFDCVNMSTAKCNTCFKFDGYRPARPVKSAGKSPALSLSAGQGGQ